MRKNQKADKNRSFMRKQIMLNYILEVPYREAIERLRKAELRLEQLERDATVLITRFSLGMRRAINYV
jgi:hypothetical protein